MKHRHVYLTLTSADYEGEALQGVFSTLEKAKEAFTFLPGTLLKWKYDREMRTWSRRNHRYRATYEVRRERVQ